MDGWLPTKVIIADFVDGVLTTDPGVGIGPEVGRLEVLVRRDGRPVGMVSLDVPEEPTALAPDLVAAAAHLPAAVATPWPRDEPATWPKVTVAIPTVFGRMEMLCLAVASLVRLDYPEFDIVLVDNRPLPREEDHARVRRVAGFPIEILHEPERGISAARNRALMSTANPYIAFTDDDVQVEPDWLRQISAPVPRRRQRGVRERPRHPDGALVPGAEPVRAFLRGVPSDVRADSPQRRPSRPE
jgi:hypothetical protein